MSSVVLSYDYCVMITLSLRVNDVIMVVCVCS